VLLEIFTVIAPVFVCAAIGFVWARMGVPYETQFVTRLVSNVGFPCLIFASLVKVDLEPATLGIMGLAALVTTAAFGLIAFVVLPVLGFDRRTFLNSMVFANTGNMGLPLCLFALGEEGLALAIAYFAVNAPLFFILGPIIQTGKANAKDILKVPHIWSVGAGISVKLLGLPLPEWTLKTLTFIAGFPIPLMLITLGVSLAGLQASYLGRSAVLALMRLGMGVGVGWAAALVFGFEGAARGVLIIECAMPAAVFNFLYAQMYDNKPNEVAGVILVSTLLTFAVLPALLWFAING